jgi:hypothetical protein
MRPSVEEIEKRARAAHEQYGVPLALAREAIAIGSGKSRGCLTVRDERGRIIRRPMRTLADRFDGDPGAR